MLSPKGYCQMDDLMHGTAAPEHAVRKVFQRLTKHRLLKSVRGVHGGFLLGQDPADITLMQVIEAVDGPFPATPCGDNHLWATGQTCPLTKTLQPMWEQFISYLRNTRVADLIAVAHHRGRVHRGPVPSDQRHQRQQTNRRARSAGESRT